MAKFSFKFISGKYQGGEFPLPDHGELVVGRAADADIVLVEDMISRKHVRIRCGVDAIELSDLGSTNGTFVNGEKISTHVLKHNDRVLVGTSIMRLSESDNPGLESAADLDSLREMMQELAERSSASSTTMSGDLSDVPLPDLLQLFASNRKNGVLTLSSHTRGTIFIKDGTLLTATVQNESSMSAKKALCRMLGWNRGLFQFEASQSAPPVAATFTGSTESQLMDALRLNDEAARVLPQLPNLDGAVRMSRPMPHRLSTLPPASLDALQAVLDAGSLRVALDRSPAPDHELVPSLVALMRTGMLTIG